MCVPHFFALFSWSVPGYNRQESCRQRFYNICCWTNTLVYWCASVKTVGDGEYWWRHKCHLIVSCKQCCTDPLSAWLLEKCVSTLFQFCTAIINEPLSSGRFRNGWKHAVVKQHLKKAGIGKKEPSNYRSMSNLPFRWKLLERIVHRQVAHLVGNNFLPESQSAYQSVIYRPRLLSSVFSDLVDALDKGQ